MGDLKSKLRARFTRRNSGIPSITSSKSSEHSAHTSESRREPLPSPLAHASIAEKGPGPDLDLGAGRGLEGKGPEASLSRDGGGDGATDRIQSEKANSVGGRGGTTTTINSSSSSHSGKPETQKAATVAGSGSGTPRTPQSQLSPAAARQDPVGGTDKDRQGSGPRHTDANQGRTTAQGKTFDVSEPTTFTTTAAKAAAAATWSTNTDSDGDSSSSSSSSSSSDDDDDDFSAPPSARDSTHTAPSSNSNLNGKSSNNSARASTDTTSTGTGPSSTIANLLPQNATADIRNDNSSSSRPGQTDMHATQAATGHDHSSAPPIATSTPLAPTSGAGPSAPSAASAPSASRHRHQLSSIDEQSTGSDKSPKHSNHHHPIADDASVEPLKLVSSTIPAASDSQRRIRLSDPPTHDTATATPNPNGSLAVRSVSTPSSASRVAVPPRRQSLLPSRQNTLIRALLSTAQADELDPANLEHLLPLNPAMATRKIWVRRPGASATMVTISEDDLVDDARELILRKYSNSLGRMFDAPDLTLRIVPREQQRQERVLGPEEPIARTLDAYYPGGQSVDEALIIDVPLRRTPKASPRNGPPHAQHINSVYFDDGGRPAEAGTDYFGPEAMANIPAAVGGAVSNGTAHPHAISVLNTGQVPQIPSPGGSRSRPYRDRPDRPRLGRQHTSSPTVLNVVGTGGHTATIAVATTHGTQQAVRVPRSRTHSNASSDQSISGSAAPPAPPIPTPPAPEAAPIPTTRAATPPPRVASPRPAAARPKKKKTAEHPALPAGMLNGGVPPISVLIVEDNIINLRLLEAFVKRLKVRWQTAMNGREAVTKWRTGGFHLVLMDIQLPVMSGLEATREIRRLERMNQIGAFSTSNGDSAEAKSATSEDDILPNREMFKSPVIIVALTASSLQSDRHEALAAGCNDFLTKPVTYVWLERKVMEWGCMQALIDFDGWRKWKDFAPGPKGEDDAAKKAKAKKNRLSLPNAPSETR